MFEKMKNNVTRIPGNLTKLNQYQKDIDHLSKLFSEQQLLELMTTTESDQILQMKPAVDILWICPYISRHLLSLNPLLACCRRYSRGER